jgi:hypothetical protein
MPQIQHRDHGGGGFVYGAAEDVGIVNAVWSNGFSLEVAHVAQQQTCSIFGFVYI